MRVALFYPNSSIIEPIDPANLWTSRRGLTGSELTCVKYAIELAKLGHSVNLFTRVPHAADKDGVIFIPYHEWASTYHKQTNWDALISCMNPEPLLIAKSGIRIFNQQVSDFGGCPPGWESHVDILAPLSFTHARHLSTLTHFPKSKYRILYNGTDVSQFHPLPKVDGKMIWASSHDRGLHWLLEAFPKIKRGYPKANLHIFYNFRGVHAFSDWTSSGNGPQDKFVEELGRRSRYTLHCLNKLKDHGVFCHESVSRDEIRKEMATSQVLAYPLDPVRYTETFGVTVLEACASGTIPVLCIDDSFEELWDDVSLNVRPPYRQNKDKFVELVVSALKGTDEAESIREKAIECAKKYDWKILAKNLDTFLQSRTLSGLPYLRA